VTVICSFVYADPADGRQHRQRAAERRRRDQNRGFSRRAQGAQDGRGTGILINMRNGWVGGWVAGGRGIKLVEERVGKIAKRA
jgi:hypothetical protein